MEIRPYGIKRVRELRHKLLGYIFKLQREAGIVQTREVREGTKTFEDMRQKLKIKEVNMNVFFLVLEIGEEMAVRHGGR